MTGDTTASSYWFNWRVLLCSLWLLISLVFASVLISKYEYRHKSKDGSRERQEEDCSGLLYEDEFWKPCLRSIHPAWLLGFRVIAFIVLLLMMILNLSVDGAGLMYFYTQWTFTLITIYFGLGSLLSTYGCYQYHNKVGGDNTEDEIVDPEFGTNGSSRPAAESSGDEKQMHPLRTSQDPDRKTAGFWGYVFQIIFQMNAGAVILTDCVFWFIIVPFLAIKDYNLNFLIINMHSINAVFLIGETALNCLRFPWFRIAYFIIWTVVYVIFQWVLHACMTIWWPYPFLDLSSSFAPLWYSSVALMHIPCYGVFVLIMKLKRCLLLKWFPQSYQCPL